MNTKPKRSMFVCGKYMVRSDGTILPRKWWTVRPETWQSEVSE